MSTKILMFSTKPFEQLSFEAMNKLNGEPVNITYLETSLGPSTLKLCENHKIICLFVTDILNASSLQTLAKMGIQLVVLRSAGFNNVDVQEAKKLGIEVVRVPAYSPEAVAEFSVGIYLSLNRKIHRAFQRVREGNYSLTGFVGKNVSGQKIGIIGTGRIGRCAAQIYRGFGAQVIAFDIHPDAEWADQHQIKYVELNELLQQSDVVSLHVPFNAQTKHILNQKTIALMKKNSILINTSRGGLIETKELIRALKTQAIAGAALDVYEEEEGVFFKDHSNDIIDDDVLSRLTTFPNVLLTSHQAFLTEEALNQIAKVSLENVGAWIQGRALKNLVTGD